MFLVVSGIELNLVLKSITSFPFGALFCIFLSPSNKNLISYESKAWIHWSVYKMHSGLGRDREYIDQETVSAFPNWPAPHVTRRLLLTKAKDSVLSAATYPQQFATNECHCVLVLINSANPLWDPDAVQAFLSAQNQRALPLCPRVLWQRSLWGFESTRQGFATMFTFFFILLIQFSVTVAFSLFRSLTPCSP